MKPKVLIIVGPTASGKKKLAFEAAMHYSGEIVSADSRKVYRYLDIGTAKPSPEEQCRVQHHLIDIIDPDEPFSAGEWVERASHAVGNIIERGHLPIVSGGTGFYISAFCEGLSENISPDPEVRKNLEKELAAKNPSALYRKLVLIDPGRAAQLHEHDTFRVLRALEIYYSTGKTFTELSKNWKVTGGEYDYFTIGITMARDILYRRINDRVDEMVSKGLVDELKAVLGMGYSGELPSLNTVGYKEWFPYLEGRESFAHCLENVKRNTRRYAKRQMTWFRARHDIHWIDAQRVDSVDKILRQAETWLSSS